MQAELEAPIRGRRSREEATAERRRRRDPGSLDRMVQMKLDFIPENALDRERFVYRWVNDDPGRIRFLTSQDEYDHVETNELGDGFDIGLTDSESDNRVRMLVGTDKSGSPQYAYLMRKPKAFWEEDYGDVVSKREDLMAGRVFQGEESEEGAKGSADFTNRYVPKGVKMGHAGERRRGPVPPK